MTAIVGPSGAGKTSLVNVLLGFLPYQGSLTINGVELHKLEPDHWRQNISWIGQNPLLVHGSILDNITLGNSNFESDQIDQVIEHASAQDFIQRYGLQHSIHDRSTGLSVGQAQRLALARAMLQNGQFWLLDEPTASLDARSEQLVLQGIEQYTQNKTTLMVTHQLAPLENVAQILVMDAGKIVEQGTFEQLSQHSGLFKQMLLSSQALTKAN